MKRLLLPIVAPFVLHAGVGPLMFCLAVVPAARVLAYEGGLHQQLTFIAARQFNRCAHETSVLQRLSALDTRYIVRANVAQSESNVFARMFRWNYYNRKDQTNRSSFGLIDTRFHDRFDQLTRRLGDAPDRAGELENLGRIVYFLQEVTSPARAVPVYTGRWWRGSTSDRFDRFGIDVAQVEHLVEDTCDVLLEANISFEDILTDAAEDTLEGVRSGILGFPVTWEVFWEFAEEADEFGEYGEAGNQFGERTEFDCGEAQRCLLLEDDPLYSGFAMQRHAAAVFATMRAMALVQTTLQSAGRER